jgi:hypothetical protein
MSFPVFMTTPLGIAQEVTDPNEYRCVGHHEKAHFGPLVPHYSSAIQNPLYEGEG